MYAYFWFVNDVMFSYRGANEPESSTTLSLEEVRQVAVPVGRQDNYSQVHKNASDCLHVKIKNHGLGQYGAEPHYSTLPFWQLYALKG